MKVLLLKDVYKLGHAGDVKKVADGFGRNYLMPQGLAVLATPGALKQADYIRTQAATQRNILNDEMRSVAEVISGAVLTFAARAGDTGKLYGSITTQSIAEKLSKKIGIEIDRRQIESQPIRNLGTHNAGIRLTVDLIPEIKIVVHREGEIQVHEDSPAITTVESVQEQEVIIEDIEEVTGDLETSTETDELIG